MRSRKAIINTIAGLSYELTAIICGFILPRLILQGFGSDYNGITSAITQFLGYSNLLKSGIEGVTRAALYKPLAEKNQMEISGVVNATERFLRKVSLIFAISLFVFGSIYAFIVRNSFDYVFTLSLVIIIGFSTFAQFFFGLTYQLILSADQRQGVYSFIQVVTTILNTILAAILIKLDMTIHVVKLGSAFVFLLNPIIVNAYAKRYYKIDKSVKPNTTAIQERWNSFGLQIANFINSNTDMLVLTVFTSVFEVSVYAIYHMATSGLRRILNSFVSGFGAAFGDMFAKNEVQAAERNLLIFEQIVFAVSNFFFSVCFVMIVPFVSVYTKNISDVNYVRYMFGYLSTVATLFTCYRIPYQAIVESVGHFKQTRNGAFLEAGLNISISVIMVKQFGIVGVTIGTLIAAMFRTFQYCIYVSKHIINRSVLILIKRILLGLVVFVFVFVLYNTLDFDVPQNYVQWILQAIQVSVISLIITISIELIFYRKTLISSISKIKVAILKH